MIFFLIPGLLFFAYWVFRQVMIFVNKLGLVNIPAIVRSCRHEFEKNPETGCITLDEFSADVEGSFEGETVNGNVILRREYQPGEQLECVYDTRMKRIAGTPDKKAKPRHFVFLVLALVFVASALIQAWLELGLFVLLSASFLAYGLIIGYREMFCVFAKHGEIQGVVINKVKSYRGGRNKVVPVYQYVLDGEKRALEGEFPRRENDYSVGEKVALRFHAKSHRVYEPRQSYGELITCAVFTIMGLFIAYLGFFL